MRARPEGRPHGRDPRDRRQSREERARCDRGLHPTRGPLSGPTPDRTHSTGTGRGSSPVQGAWRSRFGSAHPPSHGSRRGQAQVGGAHRALVPLPVASSRGRPARLRLRRSLRPNLRRSTPSSGSAWRRRSGPISRSRTGWPDGARRWAESRPDGARIWSDSTRICSGSIPGPSTRSTCGAFGWPERTFTASRSEFVDFGRFVLPGTAPC